MRTATFQIVGISPYSFSKPYDVPWIEKESHDDYDKRTWLNHAYVDEQGEAYIPGTAFKFDIADAAKRLAIKIPGKRQQTYTKNVLSGVICANPVMLGIKRDALKCEVIYAHANATRSPGARVFRRFPITPKDWKSVLVVDVIDDEIPSAVIERCVEEAGNLLGVGRFRPANGGYLGRWKVVRVKWS